MNKKLTINSDTFIWTKNKKGLIYNSQNGNYLLFQLTDEIEKICNHLNDYDNLYNIIVDINNLKSKTKEFVQNITNKKLGILNEIDKDIISLPPLLNVLNDIERLKKDKTRSESENILKYLSILTFYTGGKCKYSDYYKQTFYPYCSDIILAAEKIIDFLGTIESPYLNSINIVISDIANYSDLFSLTDYLKTLHRNITVYIHYSDVLSNINILDKLTIDNLIIKIICEADKNIKNILSHCKGKPYRYNFLVKNEKEYNICEQLAETLQSGYYTIVPIFDNNLSFFENNVFISEDDVLDTKLNKREIFAHQAINTNFFGLLSVLPDSKVYSNVNCEALGTINDSVYNLILKEFHNNYSWQLLRNQKPCCDCLFQWLCPSLSNYEFVTGKMNLCNYNND
ncbi:MAG: TIGR04150 pseudo-rSAM protein [Prevotellaceae bacterium]|jgi:pseudo-rSAM protein|nr:TIGR04150 pseudo-rSAM protein [Prevotellaceae bacterium]